MHLTKLEMMTNTHRSFITMNMTSKDNVNLVLDKPWLKHDSHGFSFHVMVIVAVIPWRMKKNNQPWGLRSVHFGELLLKPIILWCVLTYKRNAEENEIKNSSISHMNNTVKTAGICGNGLLQIRFSRHKPYL